MPTLEAACRVCKCINSYKREEIAVEKVLRVSAEVKIAILQCNISININN